jgi:monofunctional biosynthetic peptidoglycan transglycosylase
VIGSEDQNFCSHHGFDWKSIDKALKANKRGRSLRGASTISQQVARTMFLLPVRSWVRKGVEAYLTVLIEALVAQEAHPHGLSQSRRLGPRQFRRGGGVAGLFSQACVAPHARPKRRASPPCCPTRRNGMRTRRGPMSPGRTDTIVARMGEVTRDDLDSCVRK